MVIFGKKISSLKCLSCDFQKRWSFADVFKSYKFLFNFFSVSIIKKMTFIITVKTN